MAFMVFTKEEKDNLLIYKNMNESYSLAGNNLIYNIWLSKKQPINQGWSISRADLQKAYAGKKSDNISFLIDFHPSANWRIGILEIDRIHLYTYGDNKNKGYAYWTPAMFVLRDLKYKEYKRLNKRQKDEIIKEIKVKEKNISSVVEFLYLNGTDMSWNWGKNGMTNAAFLQNESREYFKKFF